MRSSATAEDLPEASFAGAAETFLNVRGIDALLRAVHACCASVFTDRAISYRARLGYDHLKVALFIVQARPETIHSRKPRLSGADVYRLSGPPGAPIVTGQAVGEKIASGRARVVKAVTGLGEVQAGEVLVAERTDPDWEPVMRRVAAIVTDSGGRTAHAAIVSREFGLPCIVGTGTATSAIRTGDPVTVCCAEGAEGHVYPGLLPFAVEHVELPALAAARRTRIMLIVGDPRRAFTLAATPNDGVGMARRRPPAQRADARLSRVFRCAVACTRSKSPAGEENSPARAAVREPVAPADRPPPVDEDLQSPAATAARTDHGHRWRTS